MRWPGNVRELKNVVQRAFIMSDRVLGVPPVLDAEVAPLTAAATAVASVDTIAMPANWRRMTIKQVRDELVTRTEERYLRMLLAENGGRIDRTASAAGIGPRAIYDAMQRYGLRKEDFKGSADRSEEVGEEAEQNAG